MGEKYLGYRYRGVSNKNMTQKDDEQEQLEELLGGNAALLQIICNPVDNTGQLVSSTPSHLVAHSIRCDI